MNRLQQGVFKQNTFGRSLVSFQIHKLFFAIKNDTLSLCNIPKQLFVLRIGLKLLDLSFYEHIEEVTFIAFLENDVALGMIAETNLLNELLKVAVSDLEVFESVDVFEKWNDIVHLFCTAQVRFFDHEFDNFALFDVQALD